MDFSELEAFLSLAETLHFARAASRVHLSPSALSRLIARLEDELGTVLLIRDTRQVRLTPAGEEFREFARDSLLRKTDLSLKIQTHDSRIRGIVRVYASVTACYSILPPFVKALADTHPELRLSVETGDPALAADMVREGKAEFAVSAIPESGYPDLDSHSVRKTPLVFAASASSPYKEKIPSGDIPLERLLSSVPVILPKGGLARQRFDAWTKRRFDAMELDRPVIAAETAGNEALLALARLGFGLALVPRLVLENSPFAEGLILYPAGPDFGDYDIGFIRRRLDNIPARSRIMMEALSAMITSVYQDQGSSR